MKKYNSEACEAIYEEVMAEFEAGLISEAEMREYDELCLANPKTENKPPVYADDNSVNVEHISHATA
jgi:DNA-binding transcriptional regulator YiaG